MSSTRGTTRVSARDGVDRADGAPQGEAIATWAIWALLAAAVLTTYSWLDRDELYRVSRSGLAGGLSRTLVLSNFPIALVAIALVLVAMDALPARAWLIGAPAIVLCAVTGVPGVVDDHDLDARPINAVPALGVALAVGLTIAASLRAGRAMHARRSLDRVRGPLVAVAVVLSIPWILADLGVYGPEWVFIMERPITGSDGTTGPAVHLGHHHGLDGALLVVTAALLSRPRLASRALAAATRWYVSLLFAYGLVNFVQDVWNEQLAKRGLVDWTIPSALNPALEPIWIAIVLVAVGAAVALRWEESVDADTGAQPPVPAVGG